MKVVIAENYDEMSAKAFEVMESVVKNNPEAVLGLATGSTPIGLYKNMIKDHNENGTSYKKIKTVNLDEYAGLDYSSDQSYVYFISTLKTRISKTEKRRTGRRNATDIINF